MAKLNEAEAKEQLNIVPDVRDVFKGSDLRVFSQYVDKRMALKAQRDAIEDEMAALSEKLTRFLADNDVDRVQHGLVRVQIISKENSRLDKDLLLHNGVPAAIIAKSMKVTHSSYLDVREVKEK